MRFYPSHLLTFGRAMMVASTRVVWPFETVFGVIDDELERRGVAPED